MQIVSGDITRDITGEIVYLKAYKQMVGEVTEYIQHLKEYSYSKAL